MALRGRIQGNHRREGMFFICSYCRDSAQSCGMYNSRAVGGRTKKEHLSRGATEAVDLWCGRGVRRLCSAALTGINDTAAAGATEGRWSTFPALPKAPSARTSESGAREAAQRLPRHLQAAPERSFPGSSIPTSLPELPSYPLSHRNEFTNNLPITPTLQEHVRSCVLYWFLIPSDEAFTNWQRLNTVNHLPLAHPRPHNSRHPGWAEVPWRS